ncbi:MAG: hypothetical protein ACI9RV_002634 [Glaciecola sp.]|jgi:hypothetical protein
MKVGKYHGRLTDKISEERAKNRVKRDLPNYIGDVRALKLMLLIQ